jgi:5'-phosphate synthase pdxT subunit
VVTAQVQSSAVDAPVARGPLVGILAVQGDVEEHENMLRRIGARVRRVKLPADLDSLDGLIIPGGESTTMGKLLRRFEMLKPLRVAIKSGLPVYGTCAGMIMLASTVRRSGVDQPLLGGVDIDVERNAFGTQVDSFEADLPIQCVGGRPFHAVFIRAPIIARTGEDVEVLARLEDGTPVAARQGSILVSSFHPELTDDDRMHRFFLDLVQNASVSSTAELSVFG